MSKSIRKLSYNAAVLAHRTGPKVREAASNFCKSYGNGWVFYVRRPLVVFIRGLLDLDAQDQFKK